MAHLAQINKDFVVENVIVVPDSVTEENAQTFGLQFGDGRWLLTSYNGTFRRSYAGIGSIYRSDVDAFQPVCPYRGFVFDDERWDWEAPVPMPASIGPWEWDEHNQSWSKCAEPEE
jgi:hypothetical protein